LKNDDLHGRSRIYLISLEVPGETLGFRCEAEKLKGQDQMAELG
jgi:hypothetical protein